MKLRYVICLALLLRRALPSGLALIRRQMYRITIRATDENVPGVLLKTLEETFTRRNEGF